MQKRLLLVEDAPDVVAFLLLLFTPARFLVTVAEDLASARAALAEQPSPDLVIIDWGLPDGGGRTLCGELKSTHALLPVLVLTAGAVARARREALAAGADGFLSKPFDREELESTVGRLAPAERQSPAVRHVCTARDGRRMTIH